MQVIKLTLGEGQFAGQTIQVHGPPDGRVYSVTVPAGLGVGDNLEIRVNPEEGLIPRKGGGFNYPPGRRFPRRTSSCSRSPKQNCVCPQYSSSARDTQPAVFCAFTFVRGGEVDRETGQTNPSLRKCSRCKKCWYVSVEAQRSHWRLHKRHCRELSDGEKRTIDNYSLEDAWTEIRSTLPLGNHKTAALFRKLRHLLDESPEAAKESDLEMDMHTTGRTILFQHSSAWNDGSVPG
jgi:hypothetical protein